MNPIQSPFNRLATAIVSGLVSIADQSFTGVKTFVNSIIAASGLITGLISNGSNISIRPSDSTIDVAKFIDTAGYGDAVLTLKSSAVNSFAMAMQQLSPGIGGLIFNAVYGGYFILGQTGQGLGIYCENNSLKFIQSANSFTNDALIEFKVTNASSVDASIAAHEFRVNNLQAGQYAKSLLIDDVRVSTIGANGCDSKKFGANMPCGVGTITVLSGGLFVTVMNSLASGMCHISISPRGSMPDWRYIIGDGAGLGPLGSFTVSVPSALSVDASFSYQITKAL